MDETPQCTASDGGHVLRFTIPGDPVGKGRPRRVRLPNGRTITHTPQKTIDFENGVRFAAQQAAARPLPGPVRLSVVFLFSMPRSRHRKGIPRPVGWKPTTSELNNLVKSVKRTSEWDRVRGRRPGGGAGGAEALGEPARTVVVARELPEIAQDAL